MLAGEAVVAIWNGISSAGRDTFYDWHLHEHMPERVGIPGFRRGRRYIAAEPGTRPEFFTLYEADTMQVLQGSDYLARLNAPTPWTRVATASFTDTSRALCRVLESRGPGMGGFALTIRFDANPAATAGLADLIRQAEAAPRITGVHLCAGDQGASGRQTAESQGRSDIKPPPNWFAMVEATDANALATILPAVDLQQAGAGSEIDRGLYRLEYIRTKTSFC